MHALTPHTLALSLSLSQHTEDGTLHLQLTKASPGEPWPGALADHPLPPPAAEAERQRLLLERFQGEVRGKEKGERRKEKGEEQRTQKRACLPQLWFSFFKTSPPFFFRPSAQHPGFDFSGAAFTGAAPDPRTFLKEDE